MSSLPSVHPKSTDSSLQVFGKLSSLLTVERHAGSSGDSAARGDLAAETESSFALCRRIVAALPLTTNDYLLAHNWLCSAHQAWRQGETQAARFQVVQILRRLKDELIEASVRERNGHADVGICQRD